MSKDAERCLSVARGDAIELCAADDAARTYVVKESDGDAGERNGRERFRLLVFLAAP